MMHFCKIAIKLFLAFILLAIGGFIYYAFRAEKLIMFAWANSIGLSNHISTIRVMLSDIQLPNFIVYCLPNALWTISYIIATDTLISITNNRLIWAISLPIIAAALEVFQALSLIPGTFDWMDLCCFLIPALTYLAYYKSKYYEKNY